MAFVNERITEQTPEKALIDELQAKYHILIVRDASIDRGRKSFLILQRENVRRDYDDLDTSHWLFMTQELLIEFTKEILIYKKISDGHYASTQKITNIVVNGVLSIDKKELLELIVEAMTVYQEGGIYASMQQYDLTVDTSEVL